MQSPTLSCRYQSLPSGIAGQVTGQEAILVGLQRVGVEVGVVVICDHPALIGEGQLRDRLVEVLELTLREADITVTDDASSHLVLVIAAAPITVGEDVGRVVVISILQLTESVLPGRIVRESIDAAPGVRAGARAWRAAYWDLARDREFWTTPAWWGALGVTVYGVDTYQTDLEG